MQRKTYNIPPAQQPPINEGGKAILAVAEELFATQGYDAVSMSEIADAAGMSKANIFHHFESKHALYLAVLRAACDESGQRLLQDMIDDALPFERRLQNFIESHLAHMLSHARANRLVLRELLENGQDRGKELAEQVFDENFSRLVSILRDGQAQGALRQDIDPAALATLLIGANVFFFETRDVLRHFKDVCFADNPRAYHDTLLAMLSHGVLVAAKKGKK